MYNKMMLKLESVIFRILTVQNRAAYKTKGRPL